MSETFCKNRIRNPIGCIYKYNFIKDFKDIKIAVAGTGYVGLSIATLLAQHHQVKAAKVIAEKIE